MVAQSVSEGERVWKMVEGEPPAGLASRDLFSYALALCESGEHPERLERLFATAARMQERDPSKKGYGNFRWSWGHEDVFDFNAVDFCMQSGSLLWLRHQDRLDNATYRNLKTLLELGVEGLLRHRVNESYTNIALMNAGNLVLLGEALGNPAAAAEGAARLNRITFHLSEAGIHEFDSPTYYGVDLTDVLLIERFAQNPRVRDQARAIRRLLWTDIALNWFPASQKLAGAHSRTYDYLRGQGELDEHLRSNGWITPPAPKASGLIYLAFQEAPAEGRFREMSRQFPRTVTQIWGTDRDQTRTHHLCADVTLSSAATGYGGRMDLPLTVDLPGPRDRVRGYFIPDGRSDPYGKKKVKESLAHSKTIHLQPLWTAAQRRVDALGLAVYRAADVPEETATLESHFVLPENVDEVWVGGEKVTIKPRQKTEFPLKPGASLVVRQGTATVGIRVPWSRDVSGAESAAALVCDGNTFGAMRLTITHHRPGQARPGDIPPGAALWVRIGSGLAGPEAVAAWRRGFDSARAEVKADGTSVSLRVNGTDGPLAVGTSAPFLSAAAPEPATPRHVLARDGEDLGAALLETVEPVKSAQKALSSNILPLPANGGTYAEAEKGLVLPPMVVADDPAAQDGHYAWMPSTPGERAGSSVGRIRLSLNASGEAPRYLWGRVLSPTPDNDSFFVSLSARRETLLPPTTWALGVRPSWTWVPLNGDNGKLLPLLLPPGLSTLDIRVREAGAKLDRVFLTTDPAARPK